MDITIGGPVTGSTFCLPLYYGVFLQIFYLNLKLNIVHISKMLYLKWYYIKTILCQFIWIATMFLKL